MIRLALILLLLGAPAFAVEPDEMLADPVLEARANALDDEIRCVQCRSENIASSNADWARDARLMVRALIADGASDADVLDFFVDRYGEVVLMTPRAQGANLVLWAAAPLMLLAALGASFAYVRSRAAAPTPETDLSDDEEARLKELLDG
ncbi:MAG: cytochrome c-type biogenesis protein [Pseudomonadota bacterium]